MEQMTVTAKIQIVVSDTDKTMLDETMSVYCDACNYVSEYVFHTHELKQFSLNKVWYCQTCKQTWEVLSSHTGNL